MPTASAWTDRVGACRRMRDLVKLERVYEARACKVYRVQHRAAPDSLLALKCYVKSRLSPGQKVQALREAWWHSQLCHPCVVDMHAAWLEEGLICMAMEFAPLGSVFREMRSHPEYFTEHAIAKYVTHPVLCALLCMHGLGLIHRDIKPENILLTDSGCKLADLGLVIDQREEAANTCLGTWCAAASAVAAPACVALPT
jgi:serine/threonine protein kinase